MKSRRYVELTLEEIDQFYEQARLFIDRHQNSKSFNDFMYNRDMEGLNDVDLLRILYFYGDDIAQLLQGGIS